MSEIRIRKAQRRDLEALLAIYNHEVLFGVATLDLTPKTLDEWEEWFRAHTGEDHPIYTAEAAGEAAGKAEAGGISAGEIAGYASLSPYREKEAYRSTVELSVYVAPAWRRRGVASALMEEILRAARENARLHTVVSVITSGNAASARLHEKFGFTFCGTIREVGMKFGSYQDIDNYSLRV